MQTVQQGPMVVVDTNHRGAGQAMELEVQFINIQALGDDQATEG